jgi:hypothetical protein
MKARLWIGAAIGACGCAAPAFAQDFETRFEASGAIVAGAFDADAGADPEALGLRLSLSGEASWLMANGAELGAAVALVAERDHPNRNPKGGSRGPCPSAAPICPFARGFTSGFGFNVPAASDDIRGGLETAYLFARGAWGEASIGRDSGAAARYGYAPPTILRLAGGASSSVDITGLGGVEVRNDASGQSMKATVETPRILGLKAGLSYTPDAAEYEGLDQGYPQDARVPGRFVPEESWEGGVSFSHTFAAGLEGQVGISALNASPAAALPGQENLETWSLGAGLGRDGWRIGATYLDSNDGVRTGGYRAASAAWVQDWGAWSMMAEAGQAWDDTVNAKAHMATIAVRREFSETWTLAGGVSYRSRKNQITSPISTNPNDGQTSVLFLELGFGL